MFGFKIGEEYEYKLSCNRFDLQADRGVGLMGGFSKTDASRDLEGELAKGFKPMQIIVSISET